MDSTHKLISAHEISRIYQLNSDFLHYLLLNGMIESSLQNNEYWILEDELSKIEKFIYWHFELEVNREGLEVLSRLWPQLESLQKEINTLHHQVKVYKSFHSSEILDWED